MKTKILISILLLVLQSCNKKTNQKNSVKNHVVKRDSVKQDTLNIKKDINIITPKLFKISETKTITHKGYLGDVAHKYYGNKAYYLPLAVYNNLKETYRLKEKTTIKIPIFSAMIKDPILGIEPEIHQEIEFILQARDLYIKHQKELFKTIDNRSLSKTQAEDLKNASILINKAIKRLSKVENSPKKMIGQLKSLAKNLEQLSKGKSDGYGYDLDMVHQRLAHAFKNGMIWSQEKTHP